MPLLIVVAQSFVIYVLLVIMLSRFGRSLMAGLTTYDYLIVVLLGSAVETGLYHGSTSLWAGLVSATTILLADHATSAAMNRCPRLRRLMAAGPVVLVHEGQILPSHLRRVRLSEQALYAAIRKRGYEHIDRVRLAVLERNGEVAVVPMR